jgi:outer membrane protein insertion porin family
MIKKILLTLLFLMSSSFLKAEMVNKLVIEGNKRVSTETIKVYGEIKINKDLTESDLNRILNNLNATDFFENVEIKLEKNILRVNVKEYPVVNQLIIVGEKKKANREQIKKLIKLKEKKSLLNLI